MNPTRRLHARNGHEALSGAVSSTADQIFFAIVKGENTPPTITAMEDDKGVAVSAAVLDFINTELPNGVWLPIPCRNVTISVGKLMLAVETPIA